MSNASAERLISRPDTGVYGPTNAEAISANTSRKPSLLLRLTAGPSVRLGMALRGMTVGAAMTGAVAYDHLAGHEMNVVHAGGPDFPANPTVLFPAVEYPDGPKTVEPTKGKPSKNFMGGDIDAKAAGPDNQPLKAIVTDPVTLEQTIVTVTNPAVELHKVEKPERPDRPREDKDTTIINKQEQSQSQSQFLIFQQQAQPDVCLNVSGIQDNVPAGLFRDAGGNCLIPPTPEAPKTPVTPPVEVVYVAQPVQKTYVAPTPKPLTVDCLPGEVTVILPEVFRNSAADMQELKRQEMCHDKRNTQQHDEIKGQIKKHDERTMDALGVPTDGNGNPTDSIYDQSERIWENDNNNKDTILDAINGKFKSVFGWFGDWLVPAAGAAGLGGALLGGLIAGRRRRGPSPEQIQEAVRLGVAQGLANRDAAVHRAGNGDGHGPDGGAHAGEQPARRAGFVGRIPVIGRTPNVNRAEQAGAAAGAVAGQEAGAHAAAAVAEQPVNQNERRVPNEDLAMFAIFNRAVYQRLREMDEAELSEFARELRVEGDQGTRDQIRDGLIRLGVLNETSRNIRFNNQMVARILANAYWNFLTEADRSAFEAMTVRYDEDEDEEGEEEEERPQAGAQA